MVPPDLPVGKDRLNTLIHGFSKKVHSKSVIVGFFLSVLLQGGCADPFFVGPEIPGPDFTSREIKNIDVWFYIRDAGGLDKPFNYNNEVVNSVVDGLTRKGYSVKHYSYIKDPELSNTLFFDNFAHLRKQYPSGPPSSDIDAVFVVFANVYYRKEFGTKDDKITWPGWYNRGVRGETPTSDIGALEIGYFVFEPSLTLKRNILTRYMSSGTVGERPYQIISTTKMGSWSIQRWRYSESQDKYIRRMVDDTLSNLPSCQ